MLRIRRERIDSQLIQSFVTKKIDTTKQTVQYLETCRIKPSYEVPVRSKTFLTFPIGTCCNKSLMKTF